MLIVYARGYALNSGRGSRFHFAADANFAGSANTFSVTNAIDTSGRQCRARRFIRLNGGATLRMC